MEQTVQIGKLHKNSIQNMQQEYHSNLTVAWGLLCMGHVENMFGKHVATQWAYGRRQCYYLMNVEFPWSCPAVIACHLIFNNTVCEALVLNIHGQCASNMFVVQPCVLWSNGFRKAKLGDGDWKISKDIEGSNAIICMKNTPLNSLHVISNHTDPYSFKDNGLVLGKKQLHQGASTWCMFLLTWAHVAFRSPRNFSLLQSTCWIASQANMLNCISSQLCWRPKFKNHWESLGATFWHPKKHVCDLIS